MASAAELNLALLPAKRPITEVDRATIDVNIRTLGLHLPVASANLPKQYQRKAALVVAMSTEAIGQVLGMVLPYPASIMGEGMVKAAGLLRRLVEKSATIEAIQATVANVVVLYYGMVEKNWEFFQTQYSGMLITLNLILIDLNQYMEHLVNRSKIRNAMLQNPLAKFNITIKELRENASFTATMNVNAFVEAVKRHVSYAHHADAQNDSGAEELLTIVEETGLDPGSPRKAATAPSESQALVALVRSGGETPQTQHAPEHPTPGEPSEIAPEASGKTRRNWMGVRTK